MSETEERIAEIKARAEAIERLGAGKDNTEQAYADDIPWLLERLERAEAEVERLRTLVDAIVTGDGEARGIGEGLRQAAVFVKGWCRCLDYYKAQGVQDPLCVACELAAELAGRAEEAEAADGS